MFGVIRKGIEKMMTDIGMPLIVMGFPYNLAGIWGSFLNPGRPAVPFKSNMDLGQMPPFSFARLPGPERSAPSQWVKWVPLPSFAALHGFQDPKTQYIFICR